MTHRRIENFKPKKKFSLMMFFCHHQRVSSNDEIIAWPKAFCVVLFAFRPDAFPFHRIETTIISHYINALEINSMELNVF